MNKLSWNEQVKLEPSLFSFLVASLLLTDKLCDSREKYCLPMRDRCLQVVSVRARGSLRVSCDRPGLGT